MKVRSSVKPICEKCKVIKRKGSIRIVRIQSTNSARANPSLGLIVIVQILSAAAARTRVNALFCC